MLVFISANASRILESTEVNWDHCVKSVRIRNFSGPYFPAFRLNLSIFSLNAVKYGPENLQIWTLFKQWIWVINGLKVKE